MSNYNLRREVIIFIVTGIIIITMSTLYACWAGSQAEKARNNYEQLKGRETDLILDYANSEKEIADLKFEITGQNQKIEALEITVASNKMFISALESKVVATEMEYQQALSYIESAEYTLKNYANIEFYYTGRRE